MKGRGCMNLLSSRPDLFGALDSEKLIGSTHELFRIIAKTRDKLGAQRELLDDYLGLLLEELDATHADDATEAGFQAATELRRLVMSIMDKSEKLTEHPLYGTAKQMIEKYSDSCKERATLSCLYSVLLSDSFAQFAVSNFLKDEGNKRSEYLNSAELIRKHGEIVRIIGSADIDRLDQAVRNRLVFSTIVTGFMQGLADDVLDCLTYRDKESGKYIFQLLSGPEFRLSID